MYLYPTGYASERMRNTMRLNPVVLPQSRCISTRRLCVELRMHPFPPSFFLSFRPVAHPRRRLSGIFKCILRRGSPRHRRDFPSRTHRGRKGFSPSFCATGRRVRGRMSPRRVRQRHKCIPSLRDF